MSQPLVEIQVTPSRTSRSLFSYVSVVVPRIGEMIALTIDDEGYLMAKVIDVLHVPLRHPKTRKVAGVDQLIASAAVVLIDTKDVAVKAFVNRVLSNLPDTSS